MTNSHQDRVRVVHNLLTFCRENGWNFDTPALADKVEKLALRMCFSPATSKSLARSTIQLLQMEKEDPVKSREVPAS